MDQTNDIDAIVDELRADAVSSAPKAVIMEEVQKLNDENVSDYVYQKTAQIIETGLTAITALKDSVVAGQDPKEIAALAQLINSVTKATDSLNKINLQTKEHKNNLEVAKVEANGTKSALGNQTNNILIATREEVMSKLFDKPQKKENLDLIEGDFSKDS